MKVKIIGAGSIGNHLAQASRRMGWEVAIVDADAAALERTKQDIYPKRYGAWDTAIRLFKAGEEPKEGFDIIMIGTPPDSHMKLALSAIAEDPRILHIEKPMATPDLAGVAEFEQAMREHPQTIVTVGYDHAVSESAAFVRDMAMKKEMGEIITIDVEFREHWKGIFGAHPWLAGPWETYLGYWKRGGGSGGEHSHALHLWFYFARALGWDGADSVKAMFDMKSEQGAEYDRIAAFLLKTKKGESEWNSLIGRVVQDVVTYPVRKWARMQGDKGYIEWYCNGVPEGDLVRWQIDGQEAQEKIFAKKRPDDFYRETVHYQALLAGDIKPEDSPLSYARGREVMKVLKEAYAV
ncbi:MAG: hypothetical protein A3J10_01960 [Candidatus Sungbacteria bacterium RIFCSPLOWO2_02_FULL_54_10]|uniref:Gfo/Idh/MocA-like oxidoreductase N-terminal domain-containing protein n=2 Tax=Candidatus Sungiibacteriota TaxID=1817917 RepID=A0A1G2L5Q1_9BACT|nr:MAG: hypothetical protein A2679_03290 [Candidatus Sungbacteria bacterium RIFCSPHIGHO2_01_FULL_54_26]OHA03170.1 MAG: hypothetical protein A3C92_03865 [Candidatus Sungbacteria bacterium RIFCSPHIGHO2_02_FULL_53_17]OHA07006.1 MAG: hypothetical protein A3B34_00115 [Candidatus Sungbacteria bacterium RIFCSPLOWO2_01_FULL_54_21]OHA12786.1 MAG: hypothetical protein A3J10_01960 [Candidatus Sungbacteria bacterium RIFCSPLOWO2_02_FULL_54_10]